MIKEDIDFALWILTLLILAFYYYIRATLLNISHMSMVCEVHFFSSRKNGRPRGAYGRIAFRIHRHRRRISNWLKPFAGRERARSSNSYLHWIDRCVHVGKGPSSRRYCRLRRFYIFG